MQVNRRPQFPRAGAELGLALLLSHLLQLAVVHAPVGLGVAPEACRISEMVIRPP